MQQEAARTHPELCSLHSPSLPFLTTTPGTQHQCPHVSPQPGSSVHWGQEKTKFHRMERASAKLLLPTTLPTAKHFKTNPNKYTGQIPVLQKERKRTTQQPSFRGSSAAASPQSKGSPSTSRGRWQLHAVVLICLYPNLLLHGTQQIRTGSGSGSAAMGTTQPRYLQRIASCSWDSPPGWHPAARWPGETGHVRAVGSRSGGALTAHLVPSPSSVPSSSSGATPGGTAAAPGTPARAPGQSCPAGPSAAPGKQCL